MNFATDLPPLIDDLERVSQLPDSQDLAELKQSLLHQQEVLLKVKDYLVFLHGQGDSLSSVSAAPMTDAQAIANAVIQELQIKKTEWVAPISQEVDQLNAQRQMLEREIYRLNQQYETILQQFPQQLLSHFQDLLQTQLSKAVELFEQRLRYISSITHSIPGLDDAGFAASESQVVGNRLSAEDTLKSVQSRLDESLKSLDSTIRTVFGSLEQDVTSYQASLTENISRLHSLGTGTIPAPSISTQTTPDTNAVAVEPTPEPEAMVTPTPESPELNSLFEVESVAAPDSDSEMPAGDSLFGADALPYQGETAAIATTPEPTPESLPEPEPVAIPVASPTPETSVREQYLDFAASVQEEDVFDGNPTPQAEDLFGDRPESDIPDDIESSTLEAETIPAASYLFGDAIATPEPEQAETQAQGLQAVITAPTKTPVTAASTPAESESTTVKTIQLLTDLLEDGALNSQDEAEIEKTNTAAMTEQPVPIEDLNPDLDAEDAAEEALPVTVLAPEQIHQLAEDLNRFEGSESSKETAVMTEVTVEAETDESLFDEANPWSN